MSKITNPRQTVLITCRSDIKVMGKSFLKDNIITVDWHMPTSFNPGLYAVSIGKSRLSCEMIRDSKGFVVNFMPYSQKKAVLYCGRHSGNHIDKYEQSGLEKEEAQTIDCPRIKEAVSCLECEVVDEKESGDHVIFIGKIMKNILKSDEKRIFHLTEDCFTTTVE